MRAIQVILNSISQLTPSIISNSSQNYLWPVSSIQLPVDFRSNVYSSYLEDTWPLARQESIPAIEILIKCLNTNIFQNRSDIEKTKRILRSTPEGEKRYEADIRERAQLSAPGGERSKSFPSSTTDQEVREFLMSNRGGHLEDLNLSCTAISDCIFEVIVKLPALKTLNLMTTVSFNFFLKIFPKFIWKIFLKFSFRNYFFVILVF